MYSLFSLSNKCCLVALLPDFYTYHNSDFFSIRIFGLLKIFGLGAIFGSVTIFDIVTTSGLVSIYGFSITILSVLIIFLVAVTLKLFSKDIIILLEIPFWSIPSLIWLYLLHNTRFYLINLFIYHLFYYG